MCIGSKQEKMEEFKYIVTQEEINQLPLGAFEGNIHLINNPDAANEAAELLMSEPVIGFDTESRPSFKKGQHFPVSLIQLATETDAYLFRLSRTGIPEKLKSLFETDSIRKIGVGMKGDMSEMRVKGVEGKNFIDLEKIAASHKFKQRGIRALAAFFLKIRVSKSAQKSNWSRDRLTPAQIKYAATDAWVCLRIYREMIKEGFTSE
jgi:ribonuclease D